jgi:hypothetical protein
MNKILVISSNGRSGSTSVQDSICQSINDIKNIGEINTEDVILDTNYVAKYIIVDNHGMNHLELFESNHPTMVIFNYRKYLFEQFLSLEIAKETKIWDQSKTPDLKNIEIVIADVGNKIYNFMNCTVIYEGILHYVTAIHPQTVILEISHEDFFDKNHSFILRDHYETKKQFPYSEKIKIIKNLDEIIKTWESIVKIYYKAIDNNKYIFDTNIEIATPNDEQILPTSD